MLSPEELNVLLRDERAWRRAAQKQIEDEFSSAASICSREASWPIFRRGTSDNAFSLKFANSLRTVSSAGGLTTTSSRACATLLRKKWDTSARCVTGCAVADPLQQFLARNLQKRRSPSKQVRPRTRSASSIREHERRRAIERVNQEIVKLERVERREITAVCWARRRALTTSFFKEMVNLLLLAELNNRRVIFRAWQEEKCALSSTMLFEQERLTNMMPWQFKRLCRLIHAETLARNRILSDERACRSLQEQCACVGYLRALEAEIEACKRRELRLLRRIT
ncbi:hypothetical protein ABL78_5316 [Leptomonas seymouri]|uniref:Uncharacterized protein n=1 Tax=Leptomonas seymouri TaxID=5684 RepID=A0A0N1PCL4_LEPSE|nr:hypothetical protein ABL78_5316 [Leptomonas seymouri]|eukprot:KPI85635.1 hypothetical protein ABL78_5316 [Leptomonas seymouri]